jgi:hypothetical protein
MFSLEEGYKTDKKTRVQCFLTFSMEHLIKFNGSDKRLKYLNQNCEISIH